MARKKDLGGLAALAGLAYMASRDKASKSEAPMGDDQYNPDVKQRSAAAPDMGEIRDEEGTLSKLRRNTETGEMYDPGSVGPTAPVRAAASRAKPSAASTASALKLTGDDQYNPDVKLRTSPATSRVGRAGQATVSNESMADKIAREAMMKRRARESAMSGEGMKKGGSVKGWGIARGSRKAKNY
jgi:hypothetical protein